MKYATLYMLKEEEKIMIAQPLEIADGFLERLRGLLGRSGLADSSAMMIPGCTSIHTFFMKFTIDAVFVDRNFRIQKAVETLSPWKAAFCFSAASVIELPKGHIQKYGLTPKTPLEVADGYA